MDEEKKVRLWALVGITLGLPALVIVNQLIYTYLLSESMSWPGVVSSYLAVVAWSSVMIFNPKPFTRTAAKERRAELKRNWFAWLVLGIIIGVILLVWAAGILLVYL